VMLLALVRAQPAPWRPERRRRVTCRAAS
jgi:hypothetical protein